ncbi:ATP-binding protein [Nonomuraea sp. K274]|uniref:ATP-binding protein n=1 Tax=Nonomuraea cypriaca TaxID=1187855 RepID=A0A931F0X9_9ACTN|nr:ATP-binding protein [Nonomuraea cypriaca]MBF8187611.1 ATP-binding protein [Nonomuraea cypriaca]
MSQPFTLHDITKLRREVAERAERRGLHGVRLRDFVLAVHESIVNAVEHAGGHGHFKLWAGGGLVRAETIDCGSGIRDGAIDGGRPPELATSGRGMYLMRRLCDEADFRTGPEGTRVVLTMHLPHGPDAHRGMRRIRVRAGHRPQCRFTA